MNGSVTMEVHRCAALQLYRDLGIAHLSRPLVCNLKLAVAEEWDAELTRSQWLRLMCSSADRRT